VRFALIAVAIAGVLASGSAASTRFNQRDVAFVTLVGHGTVTSLPRGIDCPKTCRGIIVRGTHIRLAAKAAAGWTFAGFRSKWCTGARTLCAFDLVSPHDCIGGACPVGAFGVRAVFVRNGQ